MHDPILAALRAVAAGQLSPEQALAQVRPETNLGHTVVDDAREGRTGLPEVVFGQGKTADQIGDIVGHLLGRGAPALVTRVRSEDAAAVCARHPSAVHHPMSRLLWALPAGYAPAPVPGRVLVVCAGTSDLPVAAEAELCARHFGLDVGLISDVGVAGLHRLLSRLDALREAKVLICVAGMEGALPSVLSGLVRAPVIAVPTSVGYGAHLAGFVPLLSALNACSGGIGVVNIDNGFGAAQLAWRILGGTR